MKNIDREKHISLSRYNDLSVKEKKKARESKGMVRQHF